MEKGRFPTIESVINGFKTDYVCSKCGAKKEINLIPYVNFTKNPEYYALVKDLSIFKVTCDKCGNKELIKFDVLLADDTHKYFIYLLNDEKYYDRFKYQITYFIETSLNKDGKYDFGEYKSRVVFNLNDLVEKMSIFEYGLRDDSIEIIKEMIQEKNIVDNNIYDRIYFDGMDKANLIFVLFSSRSDTVKPERISLDGNFYNKVIDKIKDTELKKDVFPCVDNNWVLRNFSSSREDTSEVSETSSEENK